MTTVILVKRFAAPLGFPIDATAPARRLGPGLKGEPTDLVAPVTEAAQLICEINLGATAIRAGIIKHPLYAAKIRRRSRRGRSVMEHGLMAPNQLAATLKSKMLTSPGIGLAVSPCPVEGMDDSRERNHAINRTMRFRKTEPVYREILLVGLPVLVHGPRKNRGCFIE